MSSQFFSSFLHFRPPSTVFLALPPVWVLPCIHSFQSVVTALVVETVLPSCDVLVGPPSLSSLRLLRDPVLSSVCLEFFLPVVVVGDCLLSHSSHELWVLARPQFFAQIDLTSIVITSHPTQRGMWYLLPW